jgi:hypothetical protein
MKKSAITDPESFLAFSIDQRRWLPLSVFVIMTGYLEIPSWSIMVLYEAISSFPHLPILLLGKEGSFIQHVL